MTHPAVVLFEGEALPEVLPACDHYAGTVQRMRKALALQHQLGAVFDITFDCEDGAPLGDEYAHAESIAALINSADNLFNRVGVRVHDSAHAAFANDLSVLVKQAGARMAYLTLPKVHSAVEVINSIEKINHIARSAGIHRLIPIHVLIETHGALHEVFEIAALSQVACLSFGLMDFISAHQGAIPASAMDSPAQFEHPLIVRAMLNIAAACHAYGKVASHNVSTQIAHPEVAGADALRAREQFAYTRKWSIHPNQIQPIVNAFAPGTHEVAHASTVLLAAAHAQWGPIQYEGKLYDRASYRYYWIILQRAQKSGIALPDKALAYFHPIH
ncbi:MAG: CoA ester lyase [Ottowia sp.]|nr:CoA ester lyase [Ottowia sp.]